MTIEEFKYLSEAYGADFSHWPKVHRDKLNALSSSDFNQMRHILTEEKKLDTLLANHQIMPADRDLFDRIIASAPILKQSKWSELSVWFKFKVAGIGLATAMAGALCVSIWTSNLTADSATSTADNVDYGQDWLG
jgi:hypothetical protein